MSDHDETLTAIFEYLDDLRESGQTNMYGASIYLERDLGLSQKYALKALGQWMETFNRTSSPAERAAIIIARGAS